MRINSISSFNYNQRKTLNFGKFMDENARKVVKEALTDKDGFDLQWCYDNYFDKIDECEYMEICTDTDGVVKGKPSDEFMKSEDYKKIEPSIDFLNMCKTLEDLSTTSNAKSLALRIESMNNTLAGINPADEHHSDNNIRPYGQYNSYAEMRIPGNDPFDIY